MRQTQHVKCADHPGQAVKSEYRSDDGHICQQARAITGRTGEANLDTALDDPAAIASAKQAHRR
jgi:cobalamin biosynthesis protein CbiG